MMPELLVIITSTSSEDDKIASKATIIAGLSHRYSLFPNNGFKVEVAISIFYKVYVSVGTRQSGVEAY